MACESWRSGKGAPKLRVGARLHCSAAAHSCYVALTGTRRGELCLDLFVFVVAKRMSHLSLQKAGRGRVKRLSEYYCCCCCWCTSSVAILAYPVHGCVCMLYLYHFTPWNCVRCLVLYVETNFKQTSLLEVRQKVIFPPFAAWL